jgi:phosphoglycolate phosphatase-like HAD superfamily hydrolase
MKSIHARTKPVAKPVVKRVVYKKTRPAWKGPSEMHPSIEKLYADYYNKHEMPPIDVRIKAFREAGYPEEILTSMKEKWEARLAARPEFDKFVHDIFGKVSTKKDAPPKKKTLSQLLNIKKPRDMRYDGDGDDDE